MSPGVRAWLRRQSAQARISWAFLLLVGLLAAVALLAALRFVQYRSASADFAERSMARERAAAELAAETGRVSLHLLTLSSGTREQRVAAYTRIDAAHQYLFASVDSLRRLETQPEKLAALDALLTAYKAAYDATVDIIEAEEAAAIRTVLAVRTQPALARLAERATEVMSDEHTHARQLVLRQAEQIRRDLYLLALAFLLAVGVALVVSRAIRRSITMPLRRTEAVARRLADGDYTQRAQVRGTDEVAGVAGALNTLAEAVAQREDEIRRLASSDALTGLPHRERFLQESAPALSAGNERLMLCLDVERMKTINALAGFDAGDAALRHCAARLREVAGDLPLGRIGGGSFAMLLPLERDVLEQAQQLRWLIEQPFDWQGQPLDLSVAIGLATAPGHAQSAEALLRCAEHALFEAKRRRVSPLVFSSRFEQERQLDLSLASSLQQAIEQGQLEAHWQPKWRLLADGTRLCDGAEGLVRWRHPERGLVPPGEFIPFAERTGRIRQITAWMLEEALRCLADPAFDGLQLSINLSTQDLHDSELDERLRALLAEHRVAPARLTLELTESGLLEPGDDPVALLQRLKGSGVKLAIDDFGTGHSALAYLQRLPIDELKIDRAFVREVDTEPRRAALLATIVQLGQSLGLAVTAEGVEREQELQLLREVGCDRVQGYLTGRPLGKAEFLRLRAGA